MHSKTPQSRLRSNEPVYVEGSAKGEVWAHFPSGTIVRALRDRTRAYPKLAGEAPPTRAIYGALTRLLPSTAVVLDAGTGAGVGALRLTEHFDEVIAIDRDPQAIAFAREYSPLATYHVGDLGELPPVPAAEQADAVVVCDVLGHLRRPAAALRALRGRVKDGATILVAEPSSHVAQHLRSPARRAYSRKALTAALVRSGYEPAAFLCEAGTFLVCTGKANLSSPAFRALVEAETAAEAGRTEQALDAYERAARSEDSRVRQEALLGRAELFFTTGRGDQAARAFFEASDAEGSDSRAVAGLARVSLAAGATADALQLGLRAVELEPTDPSAACIVARVADQLEHPEALSAWRIASNLAPDDPGVATELARCAADSGDYKLGIFAFERLRRYGDSLGAMFHVTLAWLLFAEGRVADATIEARMATAIDPREPALAELWPALEQANAPLGRG
ncbi:MAG TPA: methyltransferase domain-containing protein [Polyangiaceae bacterium]|nr:methyltransferase domain-containing protein [Polyangiaceae bacterium]